jgi:Protein of unknown function (DUF1552)
MFSRRTLLQFLGLAGASYMCSTSRRSAIAATSSAPRRIVFFLTDHGTLKQFRPDGTLLPFWTPSAPGAPDPVNLQTPWSTNTFTLGSLHQPLTAFQDQLLMLDGLDMVSANVDTSDSQDAHMNGQTHCLVAASRVAPALAGGISIDQVIARGINDASPVTALPSLELFINGRQDSQGKNASYVASAQPLPFAGGVEEIYHRLFPNGPKPTSPEEQAALAARLAREKSVLEYSAKDFSKLSSQLGQEDGRRLDAHASAIRDLEARLSVGANAACVVPEASIVNGAMVSDSAQAYVGNMDILMHLVQTALACDLTRVVTMQVGTPPDSLVGYQPGMNGTTDLHDLIHKTNGTAPELAADLGAMTVAKSYYSYHAQTYANLLGLLQAIPDVDGKTLLDNTLVVWCGDIAGGDHSLDRIPYILGGGMGGAVTSGRYVLYPRVHDPVLWPAYSVGVPHNNLFVSLANMMGVPVSTFGNSSVCTGPLSGLT